MPASTAVCQMLIDRYPSTTTCSVMTSFIGKNQLLERFWLGKYPVRSLYPQGRHGEKIWQEATYNPDFNHEGKVIKIIKLASKG